MKVFINYRRDDSAGYAGRLFDHLAARFGAANVFMDIATIEPGQDFRKAISEAVGTCDVVLVMIGRQWLGITDGQGRRRLEDPRDLVRAEIAAALADPRVRVIPVLVREAPMPGAHELPDELKELAWRNAIELSDHRFQYDAGRLIDVIERAGSKPAAEPQDTGQSTGGRRTWSLLLGIAGLGLLVGLAAYGLSALGALGAPEPSETPALTNTVSPSATDPPSPTLTPSPEPTAGVSEAVVQLIDSFYTCINSAIRDRREDYVACWDMLSDQPGEYQSNLTANGGGLDAFVDFWNDYKVSYALYYCPDQGGHFVDAEYSLHPWNNLSDTAGGTNRIEYSLARGAGGWRIVGGRVLSGRVSPYCEASPRIVYSISP